MAVSSYPFDDQDTTETQYSQLFRELQDSGVADTFGGTGFAVSANAAGMRVFAQAGFALLRGHAILSSDTETVPIEAPDAATRIDRIVLRLDPVQNGIRFAVVRGVPNAGPPALTQTDTGIFELPLARVQVDPGIGSISADKVTDDRRYVGSRIGAWTTATRPSAPRLSRLGLNVNSERWEYWTGTTWADLAPTVAWSTIAGRPLTFAPEAHRHDWADLDDVPTSFTPVAHTHDWAAVTGKPSTFTPAAHKHAAGDITSGELAIARIPTGTTGSEVALGNHSHGWGAITGKPGTFPPAGHSHSQYLESNDTIRRANGSDRVHGNDPAGSGWYSVWVDGNRNFCKNTSSIRYKRNVRDATPDPDAVLALRPRVYDRRDKTEDGVTYPGRTDEFGLIAEEVERLYPELVIYDEHGRPDALRYDLLAVVMIPHLRQQDARIADLERAVADLRDLITVRAGDAA